MAKLNCEVCGFGIPHGAMHKEIPCAKCRRKAKNTLATRQ